jgi:hypothetical protein
MNSNAIFFCSLTAIPLLAGAYFYATAESTPSVAKQQISVPRDGPTEPTDPIVHTHAAVTMPVSRKNEIRGNETEEAVAPVKADDGEVLNNLRSKFDGDVRATAKMSEIELSIHSKFLEAGIPEGVKLEAFECKASSCKGRYVATSEERMRDATRRIFIDPSTSAQTGMTAYFPHYEDSPDGSQSVEFYLVQPDYLPISERMDPEDF